MPLSENVVAKVAVVARIEIGVWVNGPLTLALAPVKRPVRPVIEVAVVPVEPPDPSFIPLAAEIAKLLAQFAAEGEGTGEGKALGPVRVTTRVDVNG